MTSSRSRASRNSRLATLLVVLAAFCLPTVAHAEKRKRVVVLELDGPKAEKFHDDLVRLIKKSHTVIPVDKWNGTAEELDASKLTDKDLKKVAKKLHVDVIIQGKIEKRRDEYLIKLKLRAGKSGSLVGDGIDTKAEGPRLDGKASKDLKDELMDAIDALESNRAGGGGDDEEADEEKPAKKKPAKKDEDEEEADEEKPAKKGFSKKSDEEADEEKPAKKKPAKKDEEEEADEEKPAKKGFSKKSDETAASRAIKGGGDDEEESPLPKTTKKRPAKKDDDEEEDGGRRKKTASKEDDEEGVEAEGEGEAMEAAQALSPGERAVDVVLGLSLNARRMSFTSAGTAPVGYKGVPVAGVLVDGTIFPLAVGHKRGGMIKNLGLTVMYDKVIKINSKANGMSLPTTEARYAFGAAFRYPFGTEATAPVIGASLRFGRQNFTISGMTELPNVNYTIVDPMLTFKYPVNDKVILGANLGVMLVLGTGQIQKADQYGAASVFGVEGELGGDYALTKNIFARAAFKFETIGFTFKGTGAKAMANSVSGARDTYLGGAVTVGYLY